MKFSNSSIILLYFPLLISLEYFFYDYSICNEIYLISKVVKKTTKDQKRRRKLEWVFPRNLWRPSQELLRRWHNRENVNVYVRWILSQMIHKFIGFLLNLHVQAIVLFLKIQSGMLEKFEE